MNLMTPGKAIKIEELKTKSLLLIEKIAARQPINAEATDSIPNPELDLTYIDIKDLLRIINPDDSLLHSPYLVDLLELEDLAPLEDLNYVFNYFDNGFANDSSVWLVIYNTFLTQGSPTFGQNKREELSSGISIPAIDVGDPGGNSFLFEYGNGIETVPMVGPDQNTWGLFSTDILGIPNFEEPREANLNCDCFILQSNAVPYNSGDYVLPDNWEITGKRIMGLRDYREEL